MTKKIAGFIFALIAILSLNVLVSSASEHILYGDMDANNKVTIRDALTVLLYTADIKELSEEQYVRADANNDGKVTIDDVKLIFECSIDMGSGIRIDEITANGTMWIAGDSIAEGGSYYVGWGQVIKDYLTDDATVNNTAFSGKTAKAFTETDNYARIMNGMKPGDVLVVCFGHNEASGLEGATQPEPSSDTVGSFKYYLKNYYIDPALRRGVQPILMSSAARAWGPFLSESDQYHYRWAQAAKQLAEEYKEKGIKLPFIDLFHETTNEYLHLGKVKALSTYHAELAPDEDGNPQYDTVHYNEKGARFAAQIMLSEMQELNFDFAKYIKEGTVVDPRQYDGIEFVPEL